MRFVAPGLYPAIVGSTPTGRIARLTYIMLEMNPSNLAASQSVEQRWQEWMGIVRMAKNAESGCRHIAKNFDAKDNKSSVIAIFRTVASWTRSTHVSNYLIVTGFFQVSTVHLYPSGKGDGPQNR